MELETIKTGQNPQRDPTVGENVDENDISAERGNRLNLLMIFRRVNVVKVFVILIAAVAVFGIGFAIGKIDLRQSNRGDNVKQGEYGAIGNKDQAKSINNDASRNFITPDDLVSRDIAINNGIEFISEDSYQSRALKILEEEGVEKGYSNQKLAQRYALLCLYYRTYSVRTDVTDDQFGHGTVPNWKVVSPWKFSWDKDECTWYGIACDTYGLVTHIELANHLLTGYIPMELKLLNGGPIGIIDFSDNRGLGQGGFPTVFSEFDSLGKFTSKIFVYLYDSNKINVQL